MALTKATPDVLSKAYVEKTDDTQNVLGGTIALTEKIFTISSGAVTPTRSNIVLAAQSGTADILDQIVTTSLSDDSIIILSVDTGDTITINDAGGAAGQIHLIDDTDLVMSSNERLCLIRDGADWYELGRTSVGFAPQYTSGLTAIAADTNQTFTHSLGAAPSLVRVVAECAIAADGYAVGDQIEAPLTSNPAGSAGDYATSVYSNATVIGLNTGSNVVAIGLTSKNLMNLATTSWKWVVKAWL
jgi:hypothetical protein